MEPVHSQIYTVRNYELGPRQTIHVRTLLDYLQETADGHLRKLGVSVQHLMKKNLLWVLASYRLLFRRLPGSGEEVTVNTWYPGREGRFYLRDFEITDSSGESVAAATSSWIVIDAVRRRPVETGEALPDLPVHKRRGVEAGFEHLPELVSPRRGDPFTVGSGCLDMYNHVNHVFCIQWALDSVSPGIGGGMVPWSIEAVFKSEVLAGDRLTAGLQPAGDDGAWLHSLTREKDGKEVTRLRTRWREKG